MAYRVTNGAGTAFATAANWDEGVNTPSIHASTSITVTSGGVFSATFTAPNTTNACTGVLVPITAKGTAGNIIATLQEATVDVAGATATIAITSLVTSTHVFFKFTTPYVFTATTAGRYRIKLNTSGASGTTTVAADSGAANFAYLVYMNSNVVPTTGDDIHIVSPNQGSSLVMNLTSSPTIGSGGNTAVPTFRSWQNAITLSNNGVLSWDTATSRTLTCKGNVLNESGGELRMGAPSAKVAAGVTAKLRFDQNGTTTNYGYQHLNGAKTILQGADKTFKKTTLVSGVGTAASPLVTADSVDWSVGDELIFKPMTDSATNYNEVEVRFIITKNSATSYILSATSGGVEAAFTYSHALGDIVNVTRQVVIDTTNTAQAWYADFAETTAASNVNLDGCRLETFGGATASKTTIIFSNLATELCELDDVVFYRNLGANISLGNNTDTRTYTWLMFYSAAAAHLAIGSLRNKTFQNCYIISAATNGIGFAGTANNTFTNLNIWACPNSTSGYALSMTNSVKCVFDSCKFDASRVSAILFNSASKMTFIDCSFGVDAANTTSEMVASADTFDEALFDNCLFGSSTLITSYTSMADGSEIKFNKFNQTTNDHRWYTPFGIARSTGSGLADTNVRTAGTLNLRIAPENSSTGFYYDFKIIAKANSAVSIFGFIQKNAAFSTDDVIVDLYLPGLTPGTDTPSATYTMPDNTSYNVFALAASHTGNVPLYATVRITGKTTTASAYLYVADFYNGTNDITNLKTWDNGKPSEIMFEQLGDASAVWAVLTSTLTTSGTIGNLLSTAARLIFYLVGR